MSSPPLSHDPTVIAALGDAIDAAATEASYFQSDPAPVTETENLDSVFGQT